MEGKSFRPLKSKEVGRKGRGDAPKTNQSGTLSGRRPYSYTLAFKSRREPEILEKQSLDLIQCSRMWKPEHGSNYGQGRTKECVHFAAKAFSFAGPRAHCYDHSSFGKIDNHLSTKYLRLIHSENFSHCTTKEINMKKIKLRNNLENVLSS